MPTYEYACTACGERTEAKQSFDDPPLQECPVCGGKLRKLYSPVGIVFKGSGFYSTDTKKRSASGKAGKTSEKTEAGGTSKKDAKRESKSESKSGSKTSTESSA